MKHVNNTLKIFLVFFIAVFIITFAISFTILFRPFYYQNIKWLEMEKNTGYTYEEITEAYDDVMDFLLFNKEFKTGSLKYSQEGKAHFEDCKKLFSFNFICLYISTSFIFIIFILQRLKVIDLKFKKFSPGIYAIFGIIAIILVLGVWGVIDFDSLFTVFHKVCFPGKDNWLFDYRTDQIITILPLELWINFCILIVSIMVLFVCGFSAYEILRRKKINTKLVNHLKD